MQLWDEAYRRLRSERRFAAYFGKKGRIPGPNDFAYRAFVLVFQEVTGFTSVPTDAPIQGPQQQLFDKGCIILGITTGAYQVQQVSGTDRLGYPPSTGPGRRDLFSVFLQYTDSEKITSDQEVLNTTTGAAINVLAQVLADPLTGEGQKDIFPRELLVPPSTGINVSVQSLQPATDGSGENMPSPTVHVVFHVVVPRE